MFKSGKVLSNNADFDNAMFFGVNVIVWQDGEIIDCGGKITKHTEDCAFIEDGYFIKQNCVFKVR